MVPRRRARDQPTRRTAWACSWVGGDAAFSVDVGTYAAKAHPELRSPALGGAVAVTYATNDLDFPTLVADTSLYYPRVVMLDVARGAARP